MSKNLKIILGILVALVIGGCLLTVLAGAIAGGFYLYSKKGPPAGPTPEISLEEPVSVEEPVNIPDNTETPDTTQEEIPDNTEVSDSNLQSLYIGTGDPEFPGGVRLSDPENPSDYEDFSSGEVYDFAKKLIKNSRWEIYKDDTFKFTPGAKMPRNDLYPLDGTAYETGKMVALTNFTIEGSGGGGKDDFSIAGNINLENEKPQLQLVMEYTFRADKQFNLGVPEGKKKKVTFTVLQEMDKK